MSILDITAKPFIWPVGIYFTLASVAAAAGMVGAWNALVGRRGAASLLFMAALTLAISTLFLVVDLAAPSEAPNVLTHFNPASAIAWGTRIVGLFLITSGLGWLLLCVRDRNTPISLPLGSLLVLCLILSLLLSWYPAWVLHQGVARPNWQHPVIGLLFVVSTFHIAYALYGAYRHPANPALSELALVTLQVAAWVTYLVQVGSAELITGRLAPLFWIAVFVIGWIVPLALSRRYSSRGVLLRIFAAIIGSAALRFLILEYGQGPEAFHV